MLKSLMSGAGLNALMLRSSDTESDTLAPSDVKEYRDMYAAVHGKPSTLTHEQLVSMVLSTEDDMEPAQWVALMVSTEAELAPSDQPVVVDTKPGSAWDYAKKMSDPQFQADLETNAQAALENKRGAAVIRRDLVRLYGLETIQTVWPIVGSSEKTHGKGTNRPLHKYPTMVRSADGETKPGEGDWYADLFDASPVGVELNKKIASLKAAKAGETAGKDVLPEHKAIAMDEIKLATEKAVLDGFRTNKKNAIIRAVNLVQRMHRINTEIEMVVELITDDGKPEGVPVKSNKLIYARNSKDAKQFRILTIGQLLALDIDKIKAAGGAYANATVKRKPKTPGGTVAVQNIKVESVDHFDDGMSAYARFFERLMADTKASNAMLVHLNSAGTNDLLLSMNAVMLGLDGYLSKPGISKRLADLLAEGKTATVKVA